ncbi:MAG: TolC family protein, partial [Alphaproteobacteria bacterium]|nr:TolC family protein [Alphaproteobacteria bacterium]
MWVLFLVIGVMPVHAQSVREAVVYALESNPAIEGARAACEVTRYEKKAEFSHYLPELNASFTAGRIYQDNATSRGLNVTRGAAYSGYGEGSIALRQMLFDGLETGNR